jgi:hypothetical protein
MRQLQNEEKIQVSKENISYRRFCKTFRAVNWRLMLAIENCLTVTCRCIDGGASLRDSLGLEEDEMSVTRGFIKGKCTSPE